MRPLVTATATAFVLLAGSTSAEVFEVNPPLTIQGAVDLALASDDPLDEIRVHPFVFDESVTIDFSGTDQEALAIVRATNVRPRITGGILVQDARRVVLGGLEVFSPTGDADAAIRIDDSVGVVVVDCRARTDGDAGGVDAANSFEVVVEDCVFRNMERTGEQGGFGVRIVGGCGHVVADSTFSGNEHRGLWVEADRTQVTKVTLADNGQGTGGAGAWLEGQRNSVKNCRFEGNDDVGLAVVGTCDVKKTVIEENAGAGLRFGADGTTLFTGGSVVKSTIRRNEGNGVLVRADQDGIEFRDNKVIDNEGAGLRLIGGRNVVVGNKVNGTAASGGSGAGVLIDAASAGNCIEQNKFKNNDGPAVRVQGDRNYLVLNRGKGDDGFVADPGADDNEGRQNVTDSGINHFP